MASNDSSSPSAALVLQVSSSRGLWRMLLILYRCRQPGWQHMEFGAVTAEKSPWSREAGGCAQLWAANAPAHQLEGLLLLQVMQSGPSCSSLVLRNICWTLWKSRWAGMHCCSWAVAAIEAMHPAGRGSLNSMACPADYTVQLFLVNLMTSESQPFEHCLLGHICSNEKVWRDHAPRPFLFPQHEDDLHCVN